MLKKAAKGFGWMFVFVLIAKIIAAAKEMAVAWRYGVSGILDAYLFSFSLITLPVVVWTNVVFSALVPILARNDKADDLGENRFLSELMGFSLVLVLIIGLAFSAIALSPILRMLLPSNHILEYSFVISLIKKLSLYAMFSIPCVVLASVLIAKGRYANAALEAVPAGVILIAILLIEDENGNALIYGTIAGAVLYLAILWWRVSYETKLSVKFTYNSNHWAKFKNSSTVMLLAQIPANLMLIIDQFILAMATVGAISQFGYATRTLALFTSLGAVAVSRALLPIISRELHAESANKGDVIYRAKKLAFLVGAIGAVVGIIGWLFAPLIVSVLFQRGGFSINDTLDVTVVFRALLVQLPFYFAGVAFVQILAASGEHHKIALGSLSNFVLKVGASYLLFKWFGVTGVALSFAVMYVFSSIYLYSCVNRIK